jgi:hypothetical protein
MDWTLPLGANRWFRQFPNQPGATIARSRLQYEAGGRAPARGAKAANLTGRCPRREYD